MKNPLMLVFFIFLIFFIPLFSQSEIQLMTFNILNYPGNDTTTRNPFFRTVISSANPDILVVQEIESQSGVNDFLSNVMNSSDDVYHAGTFIDGLGSDNALFYKPEIFEFVSNIPVQTAFRDINLFTIVYKVTNDTLLIFSVHLSPSSGTSNELQREAEINSLRKVTDNLHPGTNFILLGDFNMYHSNEPAYQKIINTSQPGYFIDSQPLEGTWNNPSYAKYHTQSSRVRIFGGGSAGGLRQRFDMILFSQSVWDSGGVTYVKGSTIRYGNDGLHYNDSINQPPNNVVSQDVADALHYTSDHLPVIVTLRFDDIVPVELDLLYPILDGNNVLLKWSTASEISNHGFDIERRSQAIIWEKIGFVKGNGTSTLHNSYQFVDKKLPPGKYQYRLKQIDFDGTYNYSPIVLVVINSSKEYTLRQNYPNPFNPITTIDFYIPQLSYTLLKIYNSLGEEVKTLIADYLQPGYHSIEWNADNLPSGMYYYQLLSGETLLFRKAALIK